MSSENIGKDIADFVKENLGKEDFGLRAGESKKEDCEFWIEKIRSL